MGEILKETEIYIVQFEWNCRIWTEGLYSSPEEARKRLEELKAANKEDNTTTGFRIVKETIKQEVVYED